MTDTNITCNYLVEVDNCNPEPDFPSDCYDIVECGAAITFGDHGSFSCAAGHSYAGLEAELGAGGLEWQRELEDRHA